VTGNIPPVIRPEHVTPRSLEMLVSELGLLSRGDLRGVEIVGLTVMTREVTPGDMFVALRGANRHGAEFVTDARDNGAVAVLTDEEGATIAANAGLPLVIVDSPRDALGEIARWIYRTDDDAPQYFGITGTNGKTSTAYLLEGVLRQLGIVTGLSTTAERHIAEQTVVSRLTTPEASELHALIARMKEVSVRAVVIEVSAQALTHNRVAGIRFDVAGFTNLSHDHLDDYRDMEEYFHAKLALFHPNVARRGVVSLDSPWGQRIVENSHIPVTTISSQGDDSAYWHVEVTEDSPDFTAFTLRSADGVSISTREPVIGRHMAANAALALVMLIEAGYDPDVIAAALERDGGIRAYLPGRTEKVSGDSGPNVYVDFGHSPDAFEHTLAAVRRFTPGKTIMVFGADGDRDATKRFDMARVAAEGCDILIITDHHPRFEDPESIRAELLVGARSVDNGPEIHEASPPEHAIRLAVSLAGEGDSILWAGPGHQDYRDIRGERTVYSARDLARAALVDAGWSV
jgi:UDP-N-acetylmuramoyl-L-alanyl-D-glutamate--2,6-diaminopimelate ligase